MIYKLSQAKLRLFRIDIPPTMPQSAKVSISIVSHMQAALIENLLHDLQAHCATPVEVILTLNVPEPIRFDPTQYRFPVMLIHNERAKGFGANHNAAFEVGRTDFFCVLNPDVRLEQDPFPTLLEILANPKIGVAAPLIVNPLGAIEDSARRFPTPGRILRKVLFKNRPADYPIKTEAVLPDWVAGMFMVFKSEIFRAAGGFDEGYFLYYEDVDLCWRLHGLGYGVVLQPTVRAIHAARRTSHRKLGYLRWHVSSMLRFFLKRAFAR